MVRALLFFLVPLAGPVIVFGRGELLAGGLFNADSLFAPALYRDIVIDGGTLAAWSFPPPGFFFPDLFFYWVLRFISGDFVTAVYAFALVQFLLFYGGLQFLGTGLVAADQPEQRRAMLAGGGIATLFILAWCAGDAVPALRLLFQLTHHTGALVIGLWAAGLLVRNHLWPLAVLIFIGVFSDILFVGFFIVPALLTTLFVGTHTGGRPRPLAFLLLPAVAGGLAFAALRSEGTLLLPSVPGDFENLLSFGKLYEIAAAGMRIISASVFRNDAVGVPTALFVLLYFGGLATILFALVRSHRRWFAVYAGTTVLVGAGLTLAGALVQNQAEPAARYMLPALILPVIALCWFVTSRLQLRPGVLIGFGCGALGLLLLAGRPFFPRLDFLSRTHPVAACLANQAPGSHDGLAGYALAKPTDLFRRAGGSDFRINQIDGAGEPRFWINSAAWYGTSAKAPVYDFILTAGLSEAMLKNKFGDPERVIDCPGTPVWIYDRPLRSPDMNTVRLWRELIGR